MELKRTCIKISLPSSKLYCIFFFIVAFAYNDLSQKFLQFESSRCDFRIVPPGIIPPIVQPEETPD